MNLRLISSLSVATALLLAAAALDALPWLRGPAPWPPEWQWGYDPKPVRPVAFLCAAASACALLALVARATANRRSGLAMSAAILLGVCLQLSLLALERTSALGELARRTVSGSFTSYHLVATRGPGRDPVDFLARHHQILPGLRKGTPHAATHPPGPVLAFRALADACLRWPALTTAVLTMAGESIYAADLVPAPTRETLAAALVGALLVCLLGVAAAAPLRLLAARVLGDEDAALRVALLWPLVPGVALMTPQLDQALALPVTAALAALARGLRVGEARDQAPAWRPAWCAASGALAGIAGFSSYGAFTMVAIGGIAVLAAAAARGGAPEQSSVTDPAERGSVTEPALDVPVERASDPAPRAASASRLLPAVALATLAAAAVFLLPALLGHKPWLSLPEALAIHRDQFTARRSYFAWLFFNAWDIALFLGLPVVVLGIDRRSRSGAALLPAARRFAFGALAALGLLLVAGVVRGEAGRILIPVMPVLLLAAFASRGEERWPSRNLALLVGGLLATIDIGLRLSWQLP